MELDPEVFIQKLRETDSHLTVLYTRGGCYKFALFLQTMYPTGIFYIRKDRKHIVLSVDTNLLDINGIVKDKENYTKMTEQDIKLSKCDKWSSDRNITLKDKKSKTPSVRPEDSHIVLNIVYFLLNCSVLAILLLNSMNLLRLPYFVSMDMISKITLLTLVLVMFSIVSRKMFVYLNKIYACRSKLQ